MFDHGTRSSSPPATIWVGVLIVGNRSRNRVLLGVMPHEPGRLREAPEVVGADIVLVDFGLAVARGSGLDGVADVGSGVQPAYDVQTRRFDDLLESAACFDREADSAAADGQARYALRSLRGKEERCGRADVRADESWDRVGGGGGGGGGFFFFFFFFFFF